jgi:NADPH-dependent F420 reductase
MDQAPSPSVIGVLGTGDVGRALAKGFADRGHEVVIGSRDPGKEDLVAWVGEQGGRVRAGTFAEAAASGEVIVLAVLGVAVESAIEQAGPEHFAGKVVIDTTNPLDFSQGFAPTLAWGHTDSGGEHTQRAVPEARVVKAFNIIGNTYFVEPRFPEGQPTMLIAGDDAAAKETVSALAMELGWPPAVDVGGIESSRLLESLCLLWVAVGARRGAFDHGFKLLTA